MWGVRRDFHCGEEGHFVHFVGNGWAHDESTGSGNVLALVLAAQNLQSSGTPMPFSDEQATDTQAQLKRMTDAEREKAAEWALAKLATNPKQTGG